MTSLLLRGVRVLDLSRSLAGPIATLLLGDLGAEIIKVEALEGDETRQWAPFVGSESVYFLSINRNKKSVAVDLRTEEGREIVRRLARRSDVVIENFRLGVAERLGVDYESLRKEKRDIIYCSIRGFGSLSPYAERPAYDLIVQAMSGIMLSTGEEGGPPVRIAFALFDIIAGLIASNAVLAALLKRGEKGSTHIEVSLYDSAVFSMSYIAMIYLLTGRKPKRWGHAHPSIVPYQAFRCADGKWIAVAVTNEKFWRNLCLALGLQICDDTRFYSNPKRVENREELVALLEEVFRSKPCDHWLRLLEESDVPAAPVNELDEALSDPHLESSGLLGYVEHSTLGKIRQLLFPALLDGIRPQPILPPPLFGEHTVEVLREMGYSEEEVMALLRRGIVRQSGSS
ncbi:MAG: CoA transferase [Sulfolobales archaeon]|nr:CoA transferase [Sulfolobales archaeon]